jgi:universal stress protein A
MSSMTPKKILFATDFSENSAKARQCAVDYAKAFEADLCIIHVINSSSIGYPSLERGVPVDIRSALETIQESVDKALQLLSAECSTSLPKVEVLSRIGVPAYEIVRFARENSVSLIVMGTHGWTGFKHLILGSTAENVVRTADCPVLTVRSSKGAW